MSVSSSVCIVRLINSPLIGYLSAITYALDPHVFKTHIAQIHEAAEALRVLNSQHQIHQQPQLEHLSGPASVTLAELNPINSMTKVTAEAFSKRDNCKRTVIL